MTLTIAHPGLALVHDASVPQREALVESWREGDAFWMALKPRGGRPCFSTELLAHLRQLRTDLRKIHEVDPFPFAVLMSHVPNVYSLGGDLDLFADCIRRGDVDALRTYAHGCIENAYASWTNYGKSLISIALVQGAALGGGFEMALTFDFIVAEESARFGLPESLFNLFPGMGAYSILSRRIGAVEAERMILSGRIYSARELQEIGIVSEVVPDGQGVDGAKALMENLSRRYNTHLAVLEARRTVNPITHDELVRVVDVWVDAAFRLSPPDLRKMDRLVHAQNRRHASAAD